MHDSASPPQNSTPPAPTPARASVVRGELRILWRAALALDAHAGFTHAAALAFWGLLALIPFLLFVSGLFGFLVSVFGGPDGTELRGQIVEGLREFFPRLEGEAASYVGGVVERRGELSLAGLPLFVLMCTALLGSLQTAIGAVFHPERQRSVAHATLVSLVLLVALLFGVAGAVLAGWALGALGGEHFRWLGALFRGAWVTWAVSLSLGTALFAVLVRVLSVERPPWRDLFLGGLFFSVFWVVARLVFAFYLDRIAAYDLLYGSLAVFVVLLVWLYYTALLFLYAAEWVAARRAR